MQTFYKKFFSLSLFIFSVSILGTHLSYAAPYDVGDIIYTDTSNENVVAVGSDGIPDNIIVTPPFDDATGVVINPSTGLIYVADSSAGKILEVDAVAGTSTTFATGSFLTPGFTHTLAIEAGGSLIVSDRSGNKIVRVDSSGTQSLLTSAGSLSDGFGIAIDSSGDIYVSNNGDGAIIKIDPVTGAQTTFLASGTLSTLQGLTLGFGDDFYVAGDGASGKGIYKVDAITAAVTFLTGTGATIPNALTFDGSTFLYATSGDGSSIFKTDSGGTKTAFATTSSAFGITFASTATPEPLSLLLLSLGLGGLFSRRRFFSTK